MKTLKIGKKEYTVISDKERYEIIRFLCDTKVDLRFEIDQLELDKIRCRNADADTSGSEIVFVHRIKYLEESKQKCEKILEMF